MVWRLVTARVATLTEIDTAWSLDDILDGTAVLDYQDALRAQADKERGRK